MPNTLVHFAIQGVANKMVSKDIDIKWVFLGCIIPDVPWIIQRILHMMLPNIDPYMLRLWVIVQASFIFCLLLSAAVAAISEKPKAIFIVLAVNSFIHLLLDACEIKPGSGVHLIAPFSWELLMFSLVWPENIIISILTVFGFFTTLLYIIKRRGSPIWLHFKLIKNNGAALLFIFLYLTLPVFFINGPAEYDNHSVKTLADKDSRIGKEVFLERDHYTPTSDGGIITTFAGEKLRIEGKLLSEPAVISIEGVFIDKDTIHATMLHENQAGYRDLATYVALMLFLILWIISIRDQLRNREKP